jgi:outer membrane protein assembly factor BamB
LSPAIATSLIVGDGVLSLGYDDKVRTFRIERRAVGWELAPKDSLVIPGFFESTPLVWDGRIYVGNRNGYFYCIGE